MENPIELLVRRIKKDGLTPEKELPPEFSYASLPLCVINAVFSIGIKYEFAKKAVEHFCTESKWAQWCESHNPKGKGEHTIEEFVKILEKYKCEKEMAKALFNDTHRTSSKEGILKAEAVLLFTKALHRSGINDFEDMVADKLDKAEVEILMIKGQHSGISFDYFRMLAGDHDLCKADRMIRGYISGAIDLEETKITPYFAKKLMKGAFASLKENGGGWENLRQLDRAIWAKESGKNG